MKKVDVKEVKRLLEEVIIDSIKSLSKKRLNPFNKEDYCRRLKVNSLAIAFNRFVDKTAKKVSVYVELNYDTKKKDWFSYINVYSDNRSELYIPITFINEIINSI